MKQPNHLFARFKLALLASALPLLALATQGQSSITNGLVAYWNFDQKNLEDSVGIYDGTENGSSPIAYVASKTGFGQTMQLDGVDQFVEITSGEPDDLAFAEGSMSVAGWFKVGAFDKDWQALIAKGEGSNWRIHRRGGETGFAHAGGTGEGPAGGPVNDGLWHHFVGISDADAVNFGTALYIDGEEYSVNATAPVLAANGKPMMIGENPDARNRTWNGQIDDLALWNRVLSTSEIAALYANGVGKPLSSFLVAELDTDKDGLPDSWETQFGFNPNDATDAAKDANANGLTNLEDYKRGLDPRDITKPTVVSAKSTGSFDTVIVTFSKQLDPATATNIANYALSPAATITSATLKGAVVTLTTAAQTPGGTPYTLTVNNVKDVNNFPVAANSTATFYSYLLTKNGVIKFSYWGGISTVAIDNLLSDPRYPDAPDLVAAASSFNSRDVFPDDTHENYGATMEGYITPTESGDYRFFIYSDDASQLFLSTDDTAANLAMIAEEAGCCNPFTEPDSPRTSEPVAMVAGKKYFIRLIYKEGGGGDYGQVAWRKSTDTTAAASLKPIPGKYLSSATDLPAPAEGTFLTQTPGVNAKAVSPSSPITIIHSDGKSAWTSNNVTLNFDGTVVKPTVTKDGNVLTLVYTPPALFPSKTKHTIILGYPSPAGAAATQEWSFETAAYQGPLNDLVKSYPGLIMGTAIQTADKGGHAATTGDRGIDFGNKGGGSFFVPDATWLNTAATNNEMSFSIWVKRYDINASSAFWAVSPTSNNNERGWQAHVPWSDNNIYFDTAGCCEGDLRRINANIDTFPDFTGDTTDVSWWTNKWRHFVFEKKGDLKSIYIDGKLFLEGNNTSPLPTDFTKLYLGADNTGAGNLMHGLVDDFSVFGTSLAPADITKLATGTAPTALAATTKLMAFWDFNAAIAPPVSGISAAISRSGANVTITWSPSGGTLESSPTLGAGATWTTVGTANPATIPFGTGDLFYRIRQ
ncbi:MAG TPA: LamG-like jellyroll fold domain-containing protein [Verrucomicrobiae bacterium]|nr:LamG-like jellyroll fold domain-containing protein [Verrucomicrobiae bacterium]